MKVMKKTYSEKKKPDKRLPQLQRVHNQMLPSLRLTPRDTAILLAVYQYRALTTPQIEELFFSSDHPKAASSKPNTRCQYRLQLLHLHGYLAREEQPQKRIEGNKPFMYFLDKRGAQLVEELLDGEDLDWNPREHSVSNLFLEHLIHTNDVRVAINTVASQHNFTITTWLDDRTLKRRQMTDIVTLVGPNGGRQKAAVVPDGYFVLDTGSHVYNHFLEVDLRTVTGVASKWGRRDWARKVCTYLEYHRSGRYQERYKTQGLRILTVTTGEKRLANLKAITEKVGGRQRFWFTTFEQVRASDVLVDPIWRVASSKDLRALTW